MKNIISETLRHVEIKERDNLLFALLVKTSKDTTKLMKSGFYVKMKYF